MDSLIGFSPVYYAIVDLFNKIGIVLVFILILVLWILLEIISSFYIQPRIFKDITARKDLLVIRRITHGSILEIIWTFLPSMILLGMAIPSFGLLYTLDIFAKAPIVIKAIGNQWYWSFELPQGLNNTTIEANLKHVLELSVGEFRLLEVDQALVLPHKVRIRALVTATDVLHSFALPQLGVKIDAVPGRLNATNLFSSLPTIIHGQCSELCGVGHGFMPIKIIFTSHI